MLRFFVDTGIDVFLSRLDHLTILSYEHPQTHQLGELRFQLAPPRRKWQHLEGSTLARVLAYFVTSEGSQGAGEIQFEMFSLGEHTEVNTVENPGFPTLPYFHSMLQDIAVMWPDAREAINDYLKQWTPETEPPPLVWRGEINGKLTVTGAPPDATTLLTSGAGNGQGEPSAAKGALVNKPDSQRPLHVFLCHASNDKPAVRALYQRLRAEGIDAWLDEEKLLPGQDWQREIPKAVRASDVVIVCLSRGSINKAGYVQKEIQFALDVADEQPEGAIFLIPAKLEECEVPDRLSRWQWVNYYEEAGWERLMRALAARSNALGIATVLISGESPRASGYEVKIARRLDWQMTSRRKSFEHDYIG